jgi:hypothetical protein
VDRKLAEGQDQKEAEMKEFGVGSRNCGLPPQEKEKEKEKEKVS